MKYAYFQTQGYREYMEDTVDIHPNVYKGYDFYAVFDGHGGDFVSTFLKEKFKPSFVDILKEQGDVAKALAATCMHLSSILQKDERAKFVGSTALVLVKSKTHVWVLNVGDCRAVLKYFDKVRYNSKQITRDHKPNDSIEVRRIQEVNGYILQDPYGTWRVGGNLAVARSFGDFYLYPAVTWKPDIYHFPITEEMRAVYLASDGVWDTISNNEAVTITQDVIEKHMSYDQEETMDAIVKTIAHEAQKKGSGDNISLIFIIV